MPDFDFDAFNHDNYEENQAVAETAAVEVEEEALPTMPNELSEVVASVSIPVTNHSTEEVDKW
ncbi:MAG: DUF3276 family protein, partial [Segetibacter sp.]